MKTTIPEPSTERLSLRQRIRLFWSTLERYAEAFEQTPYDLSSAKNWRCAFRSGLSPNNQAVLRNYWRRALHSGLPTNDSALADVIVSKYS